MLQRELRALLELEGKNGLIGTDVILKGAFQLGGKKSQVHSMKRPKNLVSGSGRPLILCSENL